MTTTRSWASPRDAAEDARSRRPSGRGPASCTPTSIPDPQAEARFKEVGRGLRGALQPRDARSLRPPRPRRPARPAGAGLRRLRLVPGPVRRLLRRRRLRPRGRRAAARRATTSWCAVEISASSSRRSAPTAQIRLEVVDACETCDGQRGRARGAGRALQHAAAARARCARWPRAVRPVSCAPRSARPAAARAHRAIEPLRGLRRARAAPEATVAPRSTSRPGSPTASASACPGRGHAGERGAPPGDLYVEVQVADDQRFERDGLDVVTRSRCPSPTRWWAPRSTVPTVEGEARVELRAGHPARRRVRAARQGLPRPQRARPRRPARGGRRAHPARARPTRAGPPCEGLAENLDEQAATARTRASSTASSTPSAEPRPADRPVRAPTPRRARAGRGLRGARRGLPGDGPVAGGQVALDFWLPAAAGRRRGGVARAPARGPGRGERRARGPRTGRRRCARSTARWRSAGACCVRPPWAPPRARPGRRRHRPGHGLRHRPARDHAGLPGAAGGAAARAAGRRRLRLGRAGHRRPAAGPRPGVGDRRRPAGRGGDDRQRARATAWACASRGGRIGRDALPAAPTGGGQPHGHAAASRWPGRSPRPAPRRAVLSGPAPARGAAACSAPSRRSAWPRPAGARTTAGARVLVARP